MTQHRPLIAAHGFQYDPKDKGGANSPAAFFAEMEGICGRPVEGFSWYSVPFQFKPTRPFTSGFQALRAWTGSWLHGQAHPYRYAWALSLKASEQLARTIEAYQGPVDIVAHSLGVRVALNALTLLPGGKVRRVVLFNGAELAVNAETLAGRTDAQILNLVVTCDRVLRWLGATCNGQGNSACVGSVGLQRRPLNWRDLVLDDLKVQARARHNRGWPIRANNPADLFDHAESYKFAGNADMVRAWLDGDNLADLTS